MLVEIFASADGGGLGRAGAEARRRTFARCMLRRRAIWAVLRLRPGLQALLLQLTRDGRLQQETWA